MLYPLSYGGGDTFVIVAIANPNSSRPPLASKRAKLYPNFPLTPHPSGRWCKKIRGRIACSRPMTSARFWTAQGNRSRP